MSGTYAKGTSVPIGKSRTEIETTLARYGADAFGYGQEEGRAVVTFRVDGRMVRFDVRMPTTADFALNPQGYRRTQIQAQNALDAEHRRLWRALLLVIKAKLEAVESGLMTFEEEFLANLVLPHGQTVGQWATPQLATIYATNEMPPLLPGGQAALGRG